jgi:putative transposase
MPWSETLPMEERQKFVRAALEKRLSMTALCELFGVAPKTGYKWLNRFGERGAEGLTDRSRRPQSNSRSMGAKQAEQIIALRRKHPTWGARKLLAWLQVRTNDEQWPAASTVTELLKRQQMVRSRPRSSPRPPPRKACLAVSDAPNAVWAADFKGYFLVGNGQRCDPLTVTDGFSRYLLCCKALPNQLLRSVRTELEMTFREYGVPTVLRTDNGPPFGTMGRGTLSRLSVWLLKLGIRPEYIDPGRPQQNGRHERMHLTLKQDTAQPPSDSISAQQRRFNAFRRLYNDERPHESLGQVPPASVYTVSPRRFPDTIPEVEYPGHYHRRRVRHNGEIKWLGHTFAVGHAFYKETVGLSEVGDDCWDIYFGPLLLGRFHNAFPNLGLVTPEPLPMSPV